MEEVKETPQYPQTTIIGKADPTKLATEPLKAGGSDKGPERKAVFNRTSVPGEVVEREKISNTPTTSSGDAPKKQDKDGERPVIPELRSVKVGPPVKLLQKNPSGQAEKKNVLKSKSQVC